jgi:hypothetical protein
MRIVRGCVVLLVLSTSPICAAAGQTAQPDPPLPARDHRLEFGLIGGAAGGLLGAIGWHLSSRHTSDRDTAGRAAAVGTFLGAGIGIFVASFSLPSSTRADPARWAPAPQTGGSRVVIQPVMTRTSHAAIVQFRF